MKSISASAGSCVSVRPITIEQTIRIGGIYIVKTQIARDNTNDKCREVHRTRKEKIRMEARKKKRKRNRKGLITYTRQ